MSARRMLNRVKWKRSRASPSRFQHWLSGFDEQRADFNANWMICGRKHSGFARSLRPPGMPRMSNCATSLRISDDAKRSYTKRNESESRLT